MKKLAYTIILISVIAMNVNSVFAWQGKTTLKKLVETSPLITLGKVAEVFSKIENDGGQEIVFTYVTIKSDSVIKGEINTPILIIKMLGGLVGETGGWSEEFISFQKDEEVLLFLHPKDKLKNIWEMKSISAKIPVKVINGFKQFDCIMLQNDEISHYDSNPYQDKKAIINKIVDFMPIRKG